MNLPLTNDEASLVRYACNELSNRRFEQAINARTAWKNQDLAEANREEALAYRAIAERISALAAPAPPAK